MSMQPNFYLLGLGVGLILSGVVIGYQLTVPFLYAKLKSKLYLEFGNSLRRAGLFEEYTRFYEKERKRRNHETRS